MPCVLRIWFPKLLLVVKALPQRSQLNSILFPECCSFRCLFRLAAWYHSPQTPHCFLPETTWIVKSLTLTAYLLTKYLFSRIFYKICCWYMLWASLRWFFKYWCVLKVLLQRSHINSGLDPELLWTSSMCLLSPLLWSHLPQWEHSARSPKKLFL